MSLERLLDALGDHNKALIIDRALSSSINALIPFSRLKQQANIQSVFWFQDQLNVTLETPITILLRSELSNVLVLQNRVKEIQALNPDVQIDLVVTDDYARSFKQELERLGIIGDISTVYSWKLYLMRDDVLSLHLKEFESLYLYKTPNSAFKLASLLNDYMKLHPELRVTKVLSKGLNSGKFVQIFKDLRENDISQMSMQEKKEFLKIDQGLYEQLSSGKQCDLLVFERNLDFLSVLLQQLSYSGIIDEVSGIDINTTELDGETVYLSVDGESESIYDKLKFMNFGMACDYLNSEAKSLQSQYDVLVKRVEVSANLIGELQQLEFLKKEVSTHTKVSEAILSNLGINEHSKFNEILEFQQDIILQNVSYSQTITKMLDLIYELTRVNDILRLISITSIVFSGLREKDFQNLSNEIIESYGIKYLLALQNMLKIGIISIRGDPAVIKSFSSLNSSLNLIPSGSTTDDKLGELMCYRGYVPLMARVLEKTLKPKSRASWKDVDMTSILGKTLDEQLAKEPPAGGAVLQDNSTVFVVMIGGVTHSEVAAVRCFEEQFEKKYGIKKRIIIVSDGYVNSKELLKSASKN